MNSRISGFYKLSPKQRRDKVVELTGLDSSSSSALVNGADIELAEGMVENVVGLFQLPLGIATNFQINGRDYLIPMVTEEPSVIAAASNAARIARESGGFKAESSQPIMIGQIQVVDHNAGSDKRILEEKESLLSYANSCDPTLVRFGGGARDLEVRHIEDMLVVHLLVDTRDAMGANAVNTMCEALAPRIEELSGGRVILKILSNYALNRTAKASARFSKDAVGGEEVVDRIMLAYRLAKADVYRAVTHNKGVMNGVSSVVLATGNDTRAVEAGCHSYAAKDGAYTSLTRWEKDVNGDLVGELEIPVAVGLVGGATKTHPVAQAAIKILGVKSAPELGQVLAAVGLAQNFAAIRALSDEGIQRGHMKLHAKNIAVNAGVPKELIDAVCEKMVGSGKVSVDEAKRILEAI